MWGYKQANIEAGKYKAYGYEGLRVYYLRITDNSGYCSALLSSTLKLICKKFQAKYWGVKSKGHGVKSFNKPHIHVLLLAKKPISLTEIAKLIPAGFNFKLWRIKSYSDLASSKKYIKEHIENKAKRGFLLKVEILALRILRRLLAILKLKLAYLVSQAHQRALLIKLREVRLVWML